MDIWFKEHLPLKALRSFPDFEGNSDNPYNGVGIHWGYDSKYRRVLLTKKDYVPRDDREILTCGNGFFDGNIDNYAEIISATELDGWTFVGIEDCQLKFQKEGGFTVIFVEIKKD